MKTKTERSLYHAQSGLSNNSGAKGNWSGQICVRVYVGTTILRIQGCIFSVSGISPDGFTGRV